MDNLKNEENERREKEEEEKKEFEEHSSLLPNKMTSNNVVRSSLSKKEEEEEEEAGADDPMANERHNEKLQTQISTRSTRGGRRESTSVENEAAINLSFFLQQHQDSIKNRSNTTSTTTTTTTTTPTTATLMMMSPQISFVTFQFLYTTVRPFTSDFLTKNVLELIFKRPVFNEFKRMEKKKPLYLYK